MVNRKNSLVKDGSRPIVSNAFFIHGLPRPLFTCPNEGILISPGLYPHLVITTTQRKEGWSIQNHILVTMQF